MFLLRPLRGTVPLILGERRRSGEEEGESTSGALFAFPLRDHVRRAQRAS